MTLVPNFVELYLAGSTILSLFQTIKPGFDFKKHILQSTNKGQDGMPAQCIRFTRSNLTATLKYTHGKKLGNTSCVTRVNFGLLFSYNLNMY